MQMRLGVTVDSLNSSQPSNVQNLGWLFYIEDEKLPSYIGIIISHYKDPY